MKTQLTLLLAFFLLAGTCISCSHTRQLSADAELTESGEASDVQASASEGGDIGEVVTEGSADGASEDVSANAQDRADSLLGGSESGTLEAAADLSNEPLSMGMESSSETTLLAQADTAQAAPELITAPPTESPFTEATLNEPSAPIAATPEKAVPAKRAFKKPSPKKVEKPIEEKQQEAKKPAPSAEEIVAKNAEAEDLHEPIPGLEEEKKEPQLASAEISSFIEKHVFAVTIGVVGCLFALFIVMRRNKNKEDHLSL